jgi:asparagine synthase (glutamine-hydrolysing)
MARVIKSMGIKMVLSGEGLMNFGGYLYFQSTKRKRISEENVRKLGKLYIC